MHTTASALTDPAFVVPPVPDAPDGIGWLRANVARFSSGAAHHRRRTLATDLLATVDPPALRTRAATMPHALPVELLAEALGIAVSAEAVAVVAGAYHPHLEAGPDTDAAVARLVEDCGGVWDEATAARIGLLVQACTATEGLVANARRNPGPGNADAVVARTLRDDPPVLATRRVGPGGTVVQVDLTGLPFGSGPHACPGREHAVAIASGMVEAVLAR